MYNGQSYGMVNGYNAQPQIPMMNPYQNLGYNAYQPLKATELVMMGGQPQFMEQPRVLSPVIPPLMPPMMPPPVDQSNTGRTAPALPPGFGYK